MRCGTLFSGFGGVEARLKGRVQFVRAIEYDPKIAAVYRRNFGDHVMVKDVRDEDFSTWGELDYGHASPVCKRASAANQWATETQEDVETAMAVCRFLRACRPRAFTLENVQQYATATGIDGKPGFKAYRLICAELNQMGYLWNPEIINAADFGVPQTRKRLIVRAVRDRFLPSLPPPVPWVGWYRALQAEQMIEVLPPSRFADWQIKRLAKSGLSFAVGNDRSTDHQGGVYGATLRYEDEPIMTIKATHYTPRAFLVDSQNANATGHITTRKSEDPALTVTANMNAKGYPRALLLSNAATMDMRESEAPALTVTSTTHVKAAMPRALLIDSRNARIDDTLSMRDGELPALTVAAGSKGYPRALLIDSKNTSQDWGKGYREDGEPAPTVVTDHKPSHQPRAILVPGANNFTAHDQDSPSVTITGHVVRMTPRALAVFQSLPSWYEFPRRAKQRRLLPDEAAWLELAQWEGQQAEWIEEWLMGDDGLICTGVGNMVPSLMIEQIVADLLGL